VIQTCRFQGIRAMAFFRDAISAHSCDLFMPSLIPQSKTWILTSNVHFHPSTDSLQDSGYQGIKDYRFNSSTPKKKPKNANLSLLEKDYNRALAQERIVIEPINRSLKVVKILSSRYRNRRRRYGLRCNLLSALYNYELALRSKIQSL